MIIAIDFDGTCVTHDFPNVGKDIGAVPILKELIKQGHKLILFTMRSDVEITVSEYPEVITKGGTYLSNAVNWFKQNDIPLFGINENPNQHTWTHSPKPYAHLYIDDAGLGIPLIDNKTYHERPFVNWIMVSAILKTQGVI